jgi:hypothetical protein
VIVVAVLATAATTLGCGRVGTTAGDRTPNPAVAGSLVAAAAKPATSDAAPTRSPAAAIAFDRDGNPIATRSFTAGQVPSADGPIWTCRYFAIRAARGSTFGLGPDLDGGPITPSTGQPVWLSCPSGYDEYVVFDPATPFGSWTA